MLAPTDLLDAAIRVVTRDGFRAMTLDGVAQEAGVSKGGLTHHFPTKEALVTAMLEHFAQRLLRELDRVAADDPVHKGRRIRSMMKVAFPELRSKRAEGVSQLAAGGRRKREPGAVKDKEQASRPQFSEVQHLFFASLAASVVNPELLDPLRRHAAEMREKMMQQSPEGLWEVITWLALDGLMVWQMLGLLPENDPLQSRMLKLLYKLSSQPPEAVFDEERDHAAS